jgi:hypothetical protein
MCRSFVGVVKNGKEKRREMMFTWFKLGIEDVRGFWGSGWAVKSQTVGKIWFNNRTTGGEGRCLVTVIFGDHVRARRVSSLKMEYINARFEGGYLRAGCNAVNAMPSMPLMLNAKTVHSRIRKSSDKSVGPVVATSCPLSRTTIPPQARLPKLLLKPEHIQTIHIPATRLALTVQHKRAHMPKRLAAALLATNKRAHNALVGPIQYCVDIGAAAPDLCVHIEVHEER